MLFCLLYLILRRVLGAGRRPQDAMDIELLVLRHQVKVLQRQVKRPRVHRLDRVLLAAASRAPPRSTWSSFMVRPETLLRWHRELVAKKWGKDRGRRGRGHRGDHSQGERPPGRSRLGGALPVPQLHPSSLLPALPKLAGVLPLLYRTGCPRRTSSRRWPKFFGTSVELLAPSL